MQIKAEIMFDVYGAEDGKCKIDGEVSEDLVANQIHYYFKKVCNQNNKAAGFDILMGEIGDCDTGISVIPVK